MSVIATFSVPASGFALGRALATGPDVRITLESMVPIADAFVPYFWTDADHAETIEATLRDDEDVERVTVVDEVGGQTLFRVQWTDPDGPIGTVLDAEAILMNAVATGDEWTFQFRFPDPDALSAFYRRCIDRGVSIELIRVHNPVERDRDTRFGLTSDQREVLVTAMEDGYFAVPRETSLVDLGETLGISDSAVSQRLRRGLSRVISATLIDEWDGPDAGDR